MMHTSSNENEKLDMMLNETKVKHGSKLSKERLITLAVLAVGIVLLIVGIVLIATASADNNSTQHEEQTQPTSSPVPPKSSLSNEARNSGLSEFLSRVKATYYELHPYLVYSDPDVTEKKVKVEYVGYDPSPEAIKKRTDSALALLNEIREKSIEASREESACTSQALPSACVRSAV